MIGRLREIEYLQTFVREAAVSGGTLLVSGGPGVGKTTLLDAAADTRERPGNDRSAASPPSSRSRSATPR